MSQVELIPITVRLTRPAFYFNHPFYLTPTRQEQTFYSHDLSDDVIRKLQLGLISGVIKFTRGQDVYDARLEAIVRPKPPVEETPPVKEEPEVEVKVEEKPAPKAAAAKAPAKTTTRSTKAAPKTTE